MNIGVLPFSDPYLHKTGGLCTVVVFDQCGLIRQVVYEPKCLLIQEPLWPYKTGVL